MKSLQLLITLHAGKEKILDFARHSAPSLIKLLRRGLHVTPESSLVGTICQACEIKRQQDWPLAAICATADGIQGASSGYWLRIDPVHLEVVMGGLLLRAPASLQLSQPEADALIADINHHWLAQKLRIVAAHPSRWYLHLSVPPILHTTPLDQMCGEYLTPNLPRGADARLFLHRINEVQMLMHSHPVNLVREDSGRPAVNGLWLWGGGKLSAGKPVLDLIAADEFDLQALAHHVGSKVAPAPQSFAELEHNGRVLVALAQSEADSAGDLSDRLAQLEQDWFRPVLRQLAWGGIRQVRLDLIGQFAVTLSPGRLWRFWR